MSKGQSLPLCWACQRGLCPSVWLFSLEPCRRFGAHVLQRHALRSFSAVAPPALRLLLLRLCACGIGSWFRIVPSCRHGIKPSSKSVVTPPSRRPFAPQRVRWCGVPCVVSNCIMFIQLSMRKVYAISF